MILPTMTLTELAKEIQSDYKEVHARWTKFNPKFNKSEIEANILSMDMEYRDYYKEK